MIQGIRLAGLLPLVCVLGLSGASSGQSGIAHSSVHPSKSIAHYPLMPESQPRPEFWLPDEPVHAMCIEGGRLYIGGHFSQVGPFTGPFAVLDVNTGVPDLAWPRCNGRVNAVVADNQGGWWLGGLFTRFGGQSRTNVAHVLGNGSIDPVAPFVGGEVFALTLDQSTLYVGGSFQTVGGQERDLAAALDTATGNVTGWGPITHHMNTSDRVTKIVVAGSTVWFSGYFDTPASFPRRHLAAVTASTGALMTGFNPNPDGLVQDVILSGSTLYVGGNFTQIGGVPRNRVASVDQNTGAAAALNPNVNGTVYALALDGSTLYIGGGFTSVGGQPRACGGAVDTVTGNLLAWNPRADIPDQTSLEIQDLVVAPTGVHAAGSFRSIGGQRQLGVARLDRVTGDALNWSGDAAGPDATEAMSLALQGGNLACAGNFCILGGARREGAAALDLVTGQLTPWRPMIYGQQGAIQIGDVLKILVSGGTAWIGGQFSFVNADTRHTLASVDTVAGATLTAFNPGFFLTGDFVKAMELRGSALLAGGSFNTPISGQSNLIALDATSGAVVPGSTGAGPTVYGLALSTDQSALYLCGQIAGVGNPNIPRNYLAAIDPTNGAVLPWNPNPDRIVAAVRFFDGQVWVAGEFVQIGGLARGGLAELDPATGVPSAFAPILRHSGVPVGASDLAFLENTLVVCGGFDTVNSQSRNFMAAFDATDGHLLGWNPAGTGSISHLEFAEGNLAVTGNTVTYANGEVRPFLGVFSVHE